MCGWCVWVRVYLSYGDTCSHYTNNNHKNRAKKSWHYKQVLSVSSSLARSLFACTLQMVEFKRATVKNKIHTYICINTHKEHTPSESTQSIPLMCWCMDGNFVHVMWKILSIDFVVSSTVPFQRKMVEKTKISTHAQLHLLKFMRKTRARENEKTKQTKLPIIRRDKSMGDRWKDRDTQKTDANKKKKNRERKMRELKKKCVLIGEFNPNKSNCK